MLDELVTQVNWIYRTIFTHKFWVDLFEWDFRDIIE